jgi:putative ABC transport system permease protein
MRANLRHLIRSLRRSPASAAAAVTTLALTFGAGAAIFAVVDAVLLTPPPIVDPDRVVTVGEAPVDDLLAAPRAVSAATFDAWRQHAALLATFAAYDPTNVTLTGIGPAERASAVLVTPTFFALLGVPVLRGRALDDGDVGEPLVVISYRFWQQRLTAAADVVGRTLVLGGQSHRIVGVLPERFFFALAAADLWVPLPRLATDAARAAPRLRVLARVRDGANVAQLGAALAEVERAAPRPARAVVTPAAAAIVGDASRSLSLLAGAAALATLMAFINLAGLLVVRALDRRRELMVRSALGAGRLEVAGELLLEAATLVAIGAAGGVLLALWLTPLAARLALEQFGAIANREVVVSWRVLALLAATSVVCVTVCAVPPALVAARRSVSDVVRRRGTASRRELRARRVLVASEVALAFVLLASVALVGRSLTRLLAVAPGFEPAGVIAMNVAVPAAAYADPAKIVAFYSTLQAALEDRLGGGSVAIVNEIPLTGDGGRRVITTDADATGREAVVREAGPAYFEVLRIPVAAGRAFDRRDGASAPLRAVISATLATQLFAREPAVGRRIQLAPAGPGVDIIGVAGDVKHRALDEETVPTVYLSGWQTVSRSRVIVVRSSRASADVVSVVREEVARLDRALPIYAVRSLTDVIAMSPGMALRRLLTTIFTAFAVLAVALGAIGLLGVVAHDVSSRRQELAVRLALGAAPQRILRIVFTQAAAIIGLGLAIGSVLWLWAARALGSLAVTTDPFEPSPIAWSALVLVVTGAVAVLPAARRAASTDPLLAIRAE